MPFSKAGGHDDTPGAWISLLWSQKYAERLPCTVTSNYCLPRGHLNGPDGTTFFPTSSHDTNTLSHTVSRPSVPADVRPSRRPAKITLPKSHPLYDMFRTISPTSSNRLPTWLPRGYCCSPCSNTESRQHRLALSSSIAAFTPHPRPEVIPKSYNRDMSCRKWRKLDVEGYGPRMIHYGCLFIHIQAQHGQVYQ